MAQLVKLLDYISRYESNPFHYPTQFIRLKQENWKKLLNEWENQRLFVSSEEADVFHETLYNNQQKRFTFNPFKKQQKNKEEQPRRSKENNPKTKTELTHHFLNQLYPLQIKWATSTLTHASFISKNFSQESNLIYLLQRFPDIYFIMYFPIFYVENAPVEANILMISPFDIEIVEIFNHSKDTSVFIEDDRFWTVEQSRKREKIISPIISLRRTEKIVQSILKYHRIDFPIKKTVMAKECKFYVSKEPYHVQLVDRLSYDSWFQAKRNFQSPLKNTQLNVMNALLKHSQTSAVKRPEWTEELISDDEQLEGT